MSDVHHRTFIDTETHLPLVGSLNKFIDIVLSFHYVIIIIIIIIKKDWQCKAGRRRLTPYQSEDPSPTLPTYRGKEEKGKIVEDKKGESN